MVIALDVETTKKPNFLPWQKDARLVTVSVATSKHRQTFVVNHPDSRGSPDEAAQQVREYLRDATTLVCHNAKFDLHWLRWLLGDDFVTGKNIYCTLVAEYLLRNQRRLDGLSLNDLAAEYGFPLKRDRVKLMWDSGYETDEIPISTLAEYSEHDCALALAIHNKQVPQLKARGLTSLFSLEMEALLSLQEMEWSGMMLDLPFLQKEAEDAEQNINILQAGLIKSLHICNLGSGDQLSAALYGGSFYAPRSELELSSLAGTLSRGGIGDIQEGRKKGEVKVTLLGLGFVPPKDAELKKAGIYSTAAPILQQLKAKTKEQEEVISQLLEVAKYQTLLSTFYRPLQEKAGEDSVIHCNLNQTITATGRLSSSSPNLQNIPRGGNAPIKRGFISRY